MYVRSEDFLLVAASRDVEKFSQRVHAGRGLPCEKSEKAPNYKWWMIVRENRNQMSIRVWRKPSRPRIAA